MSDEQAITGACPYAQCDKQFVGVSVEDVGMHFNNHLPYHAPPNLCGEYAIRFMDYRRQTL